MKRKISRSKFDFNSRTALRLRNFFIAAANLGAAAFVVQSCCNISEFSEVQKIAESDLTSCSGNHAKGKMSVVVSSRVASFDNDFLKKTWNGVMKTFIDPDVFSVKSVNSASGDPDSVRFLELDGTFGRGLGVGTRVLGALFRERGRGSGVLGTATMNHLQEALEVKSPEPDDSGKFNKVSTFEGLSQMLSPRHPDGISELYADYDATEQWAPKQVHYDEAVAELQAAAAAANPAKVVRVAVLDTGVDVNHPDLKDVIDRTLAYNALTGKAGASEVTDNQGHGTHVAGIIAGQGIGKAAGMMANVLGIAGKFNVKIVPVKVLGDDGSGDTSAINRGIRWATQNKVDIISMSLGGGSNYDCLKDQGLKDPIIQEAIDKGVIVIAAAGNETCPLGGECKKLNPAFERYTVLPCASDNVLCVGSNDSQEQPSSFSNYASSTETPSPSFRLAPDIVAPGTKILSTYPVISKFSDYKGVAVLGGTSMATPYISGIAAILKLTETADYPVNQATLKTYLQEASYQSETYKARFGAGRVDLKALSDNRKNKYINKSNQTAVQGTANPVSYSY
jgi:subtilisin family serine protease